MKIINKLNLKSRKKLFLSSLFIFVIIVFFEMIFFNKAYSQTTCGWTKAGNQVCAENKLKFDAMFKPDQLRPGSVTVNGKPVVSGGACAQTKDGKYVCDTDLKTLEKKYPMSQLDCKSINVNGNPLKDPPGCPTSKQSVGEPSDIVRQTGKTGTKNALEIAKEKQIAEENFRKQQEAAELSRQENFRKQKEAAELSRQRNAQEQLIKNNQEAEKLKKLEAVVLKGLKCAMIHAGPSPQCVYPSKDKYGNWNINPKTLYNGYATYKYNGKEYRGMFKDGKFLHNN